MSMQRQVYVGKYLQVWLPKERAVHPHWTHCPKCNQDFTTPYCPQCGGKNTPLEYNRKFDLANVFEGVFNNVDQFYACHEKEKDYDIILSNLLSQPDGIWASYEDGEIEIPKDKEFSEDWKTLMNELDSLKIRYEEKYGIVTFYL